MPSNSAISSPFAIPPLSRSQSIRLALVGAQKKKKQMRKYQRSSYLMTNASSTNGDGHHLGAAWVRIAKPAVPCPHCETVGRYLD